MSSQKKYKCPYCEYRATRPELIDHVEEEHEDFIPKGYTSARVIYNAINKKTKGTCMICHKETEWDETKQRYNTLCKNPKCKEEYIKIVRSRMVKKYGTYNLLKDAEFQKKMLENRSISGKYKFEDGGSVGYVGGYEKKFLEFMDKFLHIKSYDIMSPGPNIPYMYKGKEHVWITDYFYEPYNLVFDIKDGGDNPNTRDMKEYREKQLAKEKAIAEYGDYNYIRLTDNKFEQLILLMMELKEKEDSKKPIIRINEYSIIAESKSIISTDYTPKGKKSLSSFKRVHITESVINKYKKEYPFLSHVRCKDTKEYACDGYIWFDNNELVCMVGSTEYRDDKTKWIVSLEITKNYRGYGLSKQILDYATKTMKCKYLSVNKNNEVAKKVYDDYGFKIYYEDKSMYYMTINANIKTAQYIKESSNIKNIYHLSKSNLDGKTLEPRIPSNFLVKNGYEDSKTKRVSFAKSINGCLRGLSQNLKGMRLYVHIPEGNYSIYTPSIREVPDAKITSEVWIKEPVKLKCIGQIEILKDNGKDGIQYKYGNNIVELYGRDWNWIYKINESFEARIVHPLLPRQVTVYHGSSEKDLDMVKPVSYNMGTKLSNPRTSSFWFLDIQYAKAFSVLQLVAKNLNKITKLFIDYDMKALFPEKYKSEIVDILKLNDSYVYEKNNVNSKYLGIGHNKLFPEYTLDFQVKPDNIITVSYPESLNLINFESESYIDKRFKEFYGKHKSLIYYTGDDLLNKNKEIKSYAKNLNEEARIEDNKLPKYIYHISLQNHDGETFTPRVYENDNVEKGMERRVKRVCFSDSITRALYSIFPTGAYDSEFYVHTPDTKCKVYKTTNEDIYDSEITHELWIKEPVKMKCIGKIKVTGVSDKTKILSVDKDKAGYGKKKYFETKWHWVEKYDKDEALFESYEYIDEGVEDVIEIIKRVPKLITVLPSALETILKNSKNVYDKIKRKYYLSSYEELEFTEDNIEKYKNQSVTLSNFIIGENFDNYKGTIYVDNNKLVGFVIVYRFKDGTESFIHTISIEESYSNHGLFEQMINIAVLKHNAKVISVSQDKITAIEVLKKCGFKIFKKSLLNDEIIYFMVSTKEFINLKNKIPVFIVASYQESTTANIITAYTDSYFSHSSLSLTYDLTSLYSFGPIGLQTETIGNFKSKDSAIKVNCIFLDKNKYNKIRSEIKRMVQLGTKYNYAGILDIVIGEERESDDQNMICSEFVAAVLLKFADVDFGKAPNLVTPKDVSYLDYRKYAYNVYYGKAKNFDKDKVMNLLKTIIKFSV